MPCSGWGVLEDFEQRTKQAEKETAARRKRAKAALLDAELSMQAASDELETLELQAGRRASVAAARAAVLNTADSAPSGIRVAIPDTLDAQQAISMARDARRTGRRVSELLSAHRDIEQTAAALEAKPTSDELAEIAQTAREADAALSEAESRRRHTEELLTAAEEAARQTARLAAAAIPLLAHTCPVCGQSIDPEQTRRRLHRIADDAPALLELREALKADTAHTRQVSQRATESQAALAAAEADYARWEHIIARREELTAALSHLPCDLSEWLSVPVFSVDMLEANGTEISGFFTGCALSLERYCDAAAEALTASDLERARSVLDNAAATLEHRQAEYERADEHASRLKRLANAVTQARVDVATRRFAAIEPLLTDIYHRLNPHPTFKNLRFEHDVYYRKGRTNPVVADTSHHVQADPLIVFSTSQANIVALSCFLAMSLGGGERALPFVLIDDPLQSLDDVNVLGFADLCRFLRSHKQLMVSTHDRRFTSLLKRKLAPRNPAHRTITHVFNSWDRHGPSVETQTLDYQASDADLRILTRTG